MVDIKDTSWAFSFILKCRLDKLLVNIDSMEVIIVLGLFSSVFIRFRIFNGLVAYRAKFRLVVAQGIRALHFTIFPIMHDQLLENDL